MSMEIRNRWTGAVIKAVEGDTLCDANLCDADLSGADLRYTDLRGADLCDANLRGADLSGANLRGANLRYTDLRDANLCDANLRGADLSGADLRYADLRYTDLRDANLCDADLSGADLRDANLRYTDLRGAKREIDGEVAITLRGPRPILTLGPLGSRDGYIMALLTSAGLRIECGCFRGKSLEEFKKAIEKTHANNPRHRTEYLAAVRMIKAWAQVEANYAAEWERDNPVEVRND